MNHNDLPGFIRNPTLNVDNDRVQELRVKTYKRIGPESHRGAVYESASEVEWPDNRTLEYPAW